ncbi:MAG: glycine cleavage system protein GcvH [Deltaproteobacteria bacterium]|nr:glycine cleavage system protein GcvH [Deltaproteobacteria bacterium]
MKEIQELSIPDDLRYAKDHEWARREADLVRVGISDYAQDQLGDIVFVELPEVGSVFDKGQEFGSIESVKVVSDLYMPVGGEIVEINTALEETPELVNQQPYNEGWLVVIKPADIAELDGLMEQKAYVAMLGGEE